MSELDQYDYELPGRLIAQSPVNTRTDARLLVVDRRHGSLMHKHVRDLPELLGPDDCLVLNNTRVVPARLVGRRTLTGGNWEGLFLESDASGVWRLMGKTRGKLAVGETITLVNATGQDDILLELAARQPDGTWVARPIVEEVMPMEATFALLDRIGRIPLPPYIRKGEMVESDRQQYQTVYAEKPGAVAAPTAGLHFSQSLLQRLGDQGVTLCRVTLHVGLGTFRPISGESLDEHQMHSEWGCIAAGSIESIATCRRRGGRVIAVGTTSVRLLETAAAGGALQPFSGHTDLFIRPPYEFRAVDAVLTNFHLPRSTPILMAAAFAGRERLLQAYKFAVRQRFRFYSYGDAMLIT